MAEYRVSFSRSARKELEGLPRQIVERIFPKIEALVVQPRPTGSTKLKGGLNLWRIRVGDYRVLYSIDDGQRVIDVVAVRHRSGAYRD